MERKMEFHFTIFQEKMQKLSLIDEFREMWLNVENKERQVLKELLKIATIESIGSSTRIDLSIYWSNELSELLSNYSRNTLK